MRAWSEAESRDAAAAEALSMMRMRLTVSETKVCGTVIEEVHRHVSACAVCGRAFPLLGFKLSNTQQSYVSVCLAPTPPCCAGSNLCRGARAPTRRLSTQWEHLRRVARVRALRPQRDAVARATLRW